VNGIASALEGPEPAASPAAEFTWTGRLAAAGTLVLGAGFQLAAFLTEKQHDKTVDRLRWIADHPERANAAKLFDLLAMPFLFGTVLVYVLLARQRSPRLAYAGGILLGCGLVGLTATQGFETLEFKLAEDGALSSRALAHLVDNISIAPAAAMLILFVPGAFLGLLTMSVALWRSRAVPRGAVALLPVFILLDFALQMGALGHAVALLGACWIASAVLRSARVAPD
jgi:hypothetical protein